MKYLAGSIAALLLLLGGWYAITNMQTSGSESAPSDEALTVVTSFYPLQFALERIVGDLGTVENIGAGTDPHDYAPTTKDILTMQRADAVVLQGAGFEPWGADVEVQLTADNIPVVIATADITLHEGGHQHAHDNEHDHTHEDEHEHEDAAEHSHESASHEHNDNHEHAEDMHDHGMYDPHTWLDPVLFHDMVAHIAEEIAAIDPDHAATYRANAQMLQEELLELDKEYSNTLETCALNDVIASHDAFSYLAQRYGFIVHSIAGLSTQDMPSAITLATLKEEAEEGIGAILLEENSIAAYGETLARETGLATLPINPIAYNIGPSETYLTLMRSNLTTFATALECNE